jgi:hypothetical protein
MQMHILNSAGLGPFVCVLTLLNAVSFYACIETRESQYLELEPDEILNTVLSMD